MSKERHKLVASSYLVLVREYEVLLLRRFNTGYEDGNYSLVAGHVEKGETFTDTIIREAKEEAGITLSPNDLRVVHVMHRLSDKNDEERLDVFFTTANWSGEIKNMEPAKCDDLSWFDFNELPENTIPYIKKFLYYFQRGKVYSEFGWQLQFEKAHFFRK